MEPDPRQKDLPFGYRPEEEHRAPAPSDWQRLPEGVAEEIERRSWRRAAFLFIATLLSTLWVGTRWATTVLDRPVTLLDGWIFAVPLMVILLCHEFGHYLFARRHGVVVSPPYFLPIPNLIGTMGAFISIRSPIPDRKVLFDISAAGPLAGFVPSVIALVIGYELSTVAPMITEPGMVVYSFGDSLLTLIIQQLTIGPLPEGMEIWIHPVGFAGWVGLLVTMLNLIPIGTLDGGHLAYALFGRRQWAASYFILGGILFLGITVHWIWITFPLFLTVAISLVWMIMKRTGRTGARLIDYWKGLLLKHPPVPDESPLDPGRRLLGWVCLIVFLLCFIPAPLRAFIT